MDLTEATFWHAVKQKSDLRDLFCIYAGYSDTFCLMTDFSKSSIVIK